MMPESPFGLYPLQSGILLSLVWIFSGLSPFIIWIFIHSTAICSLCGSQRNCSEIQIPVTTSQPTPLVEAFSSPRGQNSTLNPK